MSNLYDFYLNIEAQQSWNIQASTLRQQVSNLREQGDKGDQMHVVAKILNMKDKIMQQILAALLYKKTVIWTDLKINPGASTDNSDVIYAAAKIVQVKDKIDELLATRGYLPSRDEYQPIDPERAGAYTDTTPEVEGQEPQSTDFTELLEAVIESNIDMETLIKDKFLFSKEKIQGFLDTNPVQGTLREQVEELNLKIQELEAQNRDALDRLNENEKGQSDQQNVQIRLDRAQEEIANLNITLSDRERRLKELAAKL